MPLKFVVMDKKKIAFVIYSLESGGAERVVATLANTLIYHYEVSIITLFKGKSVYELDNSVRLFYCIDDIPLRTNPVKSLKTNCSLYKNLKNILKEQLIELAIGFMTTSNVLVALASKSINIPCIISERSNPFIYTHNAFWQHLVKWSFPKSDYLIVQSPLAKLYYQNILPIDNIAILPNPLSKELVNKKNLIVQKKNIILNVGRLDGNKSQDLLIKSFSNMPNDNWELIFVGEGPLLCTYQKLVDKLGISDKVKFIGKTNDVSHFYNQSKIFAFTSKSEGFPNVLIEAMYFELACISTDCESGPSELIIDGMNGFLIPVDDQLALEHKLKRLIFDSELCQTFGRNALKTAMLYKTDNVIIQWKHIIDNLL